VYPKSFCSLPELGVRKRTVDERTSKGLTIAFEQEQQLTRINADLRMYADYTIALVVLAVLDE